MTARFRSNVDHTRLISKSIFVTNFPDNTTSKDLSEVCQGHGTVVDVYIPNRKSKSGKRFAFVLFIKVENVDRLVGNLYTLWIGRMHLHANVVRFEHSPIHSSRPTNPIRSDNTGAPSFVSALKCSLNISLPISSSPAMVLDDSCVVKRDLDNYVMGEFKQFSSINNLRVLLSNEGFRNVKLTYLEGLWVMIELESSKTKTKFMQHVGVTSWFSRLCNAQSDFVSKERIVWVNIEGVPLYAWVLMRIMLETSKQVNLDAESNVEGVSETYFGEHDDNLGNDHALIQPLNEKETFNDPFNIYDLLMKHDKGEVKGTDQAKSQSRYEGSKVKKEWIRELNIKHKVNFLTLQETKMDSISSMDVNLLWGNYNFNHVFSEAVNNSGGILSTGKRSLWSYITSLITRWNGDCMVWATLTKSDAWKIVWGRFLTCKGLMSSITSSRTRGVMADGEWMDDPSRVKEEFCLHFATRFQAPGVNRSRLNFRFPNRLNPNHVGVLENLITRDEIRNAKWACRENKSPGQTDLLLNFSAMMFKVDFAKAYDSIRAVDAGIFTGIKFDSSLTISHLFYVDDAVFIGEWSNANLTGLMVGGNSSTIKAWDETIGKLKARLSNWKLKTLSIEGRLVLLKSVLGSTPIYNMSLYKVPKSVLHSMKSIRRNFFNGIQGDERKIAWVKWSKAWDLNGEGVFRVKDLLNLLDESFLPKDSTATRWVKSIPIKINVLAWKVYLDRLPTRLNLIRRVV
nr:RNA-directed DNA polymerase, eukaryota, nucleotide-binding alpha-beta plait domain protein [Tanacetum cinerariifolium]